MDSWWLVIDAAALSPSSRLLWTSLPYDGFHSAMTSATDGFSSCSYSLTMSFPWRADERQCMCLSESPRKYSRVP